MRAWTADDARTILAGTHDDRFSVGWSQWLTRVLRRGELCGLGWTAADFERNALRVFATRVVVDGVPTGSVPKTRAGVRSVPLDAQRAGRLRASVVLPDGDPPPPNSFVGRGGKLHAIVDNGWYKFALDEVPS